MSQDDQNPDDRKEGYEDQVSDETTREGRADSSPTDSEQQSQDPQRPDDADLDEADDTDEDRDDDSRTDGGSNRRNNIG